MIRVGQYYENRDIESHDNCTKGIFQYHDTGIWDYH